MNKDVRIGLYGGSYIHLVECKITHFPDYGYPKFVTFEAPNVHITLQYHSIEYIVPNWKEKEIK